MKKVLCVFVSIFMLFSTCEAYTKWLKYVNERFGYSIDYPQIFVKKRESNNGDGLWLESKDGKIKLTLSGGYNVLDWTGHDMLQWDTSKDIIEMDINAVSYKNVYYENNNIVHHYGTIDERTWAAFWLTFPKNRKKELDAAIKRMERTLQLGSDDWEENIIIE